MTTDLERLALALLEAGPEGLTRSGVNAVFLAHLAGHRLDVLLEGLEARGLVRRWRVPTDGRPSTRWALVPGEPVHWTVEDVDAFWRAWLRPFGLWLDTVLPRPGDLLYRIEDAGRRGVSLRCALEAVERYQKSTPVPSIDAWGVTLKKALPVALAGAAE